MIGTSALAGHVALLADNDTDKGSPIGLFLLLVIALAVYFLWRSMNRHIKKLPQNFEAPVLAEPSDPRIISTDLLAASDVAGQDETGPAVNSQDAPAPVSVSKDEPGSAALRSPREDEPGPL